jgi:hypothetical protein
MTLILKSSVIRFGIQRAVTYTSFILGGVLETNCYDSYWVNTERV